jgi:ABC-type glycerol-3-phosphate transport system substrate-binding protein
MKSLSRRKFLKLASLASAGGILAACAPTGATGTATAPPAATSAGPVTLHWYNPHGSPSFLPQWTKLISDFEAQNANIKISNDIVGWGDLATKIQADMTAGTLPDMTTTGLQAMLQYHTQGIAVETDPVIDRLKADGVEFNPALLKQAEINGKHYGLPRYFVITGLTYRKDWFQDAGIALAGGADKPQFTWEEFAAACKAVHNPPDRYAYAAPWGSGDGPKHVWNFFQGNGFYLVREDGTLDWDNPKVKETYEFILEMVQTYSPPGVVTYTLDNVNADFAAERVAMAAGDGDVNTALNDNMPAWLENKPSEHLGFMSYPYNTTPMGGMYGGTVGYVLFDAKHIDQTYEWCRFFFQDDNLIASIFPYRVLAVPATLTAQNSTAFTADPAVVAWKSVLDQMTLAATLNAPAPIASHFGPYEYSQQIESSGILEGVVQSVLAGNGSLDEALATAKTKLEDLLTA